MLHLRRRTEQAFPTFYHSIPWVSAAQALPRKQGYSQQVIQNAVFERSRKNNITLSSKSGLFIWEVEILGNRLFFNVTFFTNDFEVWKSWMRLLEYHQIKAVY